MRVAMYVRVSTQRQAQSQTIEQQLERLQAHIQAQGWEWREELIFRDDGYSGATLNRPGLDRLRDKVAIGEVDRVILTAPDRLARKYVHQVLLLEEMEGLGCEVEFVERPMSQDPHDQLVLQIRGAVAEYERTLIAAHAPGTTEESASRGVAALGVCALWVPGRSGSAARSLWGEGRGSRGRRGPGNLRHLWARAGQSFPLGPILASPGAALAQRPEALESGHAAGDFEQSALHRSALYGAQPSPSGARATFGHPPHWASFDQLGGCSPPGVDPGGQCTGPGQPGTVRVGPSQTLS